MSDSASQQVSPTKGRRGRGRPPSKHVAPKPVVKKATTGRRGRQKVYEPTKAQAAHERQREMKAAYATVAAAMRPALEDLADRNLDLLKKNFDAHQEVDAYQEITGFIDQRQQGRLSELDTKLNADLTTHKHEWEAKQHYLKDAFEVNHSNPIHSMLN